MFQETSILSPRYSALKMDYAYINTRIRAMQGRLFGAKESQALLAEETLEGFQQAFERTRSQFSVTGPPLRDRGERTTGNGTLLDEAFRRDLVHSLSTLRSFTSGRPRELMEAILLRWDAYNLKTILRGKRAAAHGEEILASTFPVGVLDEIALAELTFAPSPQALVAILATWQVPLVRPLREALKSPGVTETLQPLEFELDRFTFERAFKAVFAGDDNDRKVKDYLRVLVDHTNLLTALRHLRERTGAPMAPRVALGYEAGRHFLDFEGSLTRTHYLAVVGARDLRQGLSLLGETRYAWLAESFAERETVPLSLVERELDRGLIRYAVRLARQDPLGIGVALAYLERKINEVRNLRTIMQSKVQGMGPDQIAQWLIIEPGQEARSSSNMV